MKDSRTDVPVTTAVRFLRDKKIEFEPYLYNYVDQGGTGHAAKELHVPEHCVVKTIILQTDSGEPLVVLMHGDCDISTKELARVMEVKHVTQCNERDANRYTGYVVGGISPFGTKRTLRICIQRTILSLPEIYINGGKRGFLVKINPQDIQRAFPYTEVEVAVPRSNG